MEDRTITVTGQSKLLIPPDTIIISMTLTTMNEKYTQALNDAGESLMVLRQCLSSVGFNKEDIKTTDFRVSTIYENVKDDNGNFKRIFKGYEVVNGLKIEFEQDPSTLAKVLNSISNCDAKPEFYISYDIKNKKLLEHRLITEAIQDAQLKAEVMAEAAKVKLGKILKMEGGQSTIGNMNNPIMFSKSLEGALDLQPESIIGEASVVMVWRIEG